MAGPFAITTTGKQHQLNEEQQAEVTFTVTNQLQRQLTGRARLVALGDTDAAWLSIVGEEERPFQVADTRQYTVAVNVAPGTPAGEYLLRLDMIGVENPDELYSEGPTVAFTVPEPPPPPRPFPWWIVAAAVAVVIVGGLLIWLLTRGGPELALQIASVQEPVVAGTVGDYTLSVNNEGRREATDVVVTVELPEGVVLVTEPLDERCGAEERALSCEIGVVDGDSATDIELQMAVDGRRRGDLEFVMTASGANLDETPPVTTAIPLTVDAQLEVNVEGPDEGRVGDELPFQGAVSNNGRSAMTGVRISYVRPEGISLVSWPEECSEEESGLLCELEAVAPGGFVPLNFSLAAGSEAVGDLLTLLEVQSAEVQGEAQTTTAISQNTGLSITLNQPGEDVVTVLEGDTVAIVLRISNNTERAAREVTMRYTLPEGIDFDRTREDRVVDVRSCVDEEATREISCLVGDLAGGDSATIELFVVPDTIGQSEHEFVLQSTGFTPESAALELTAVEKLVCSAGCDFSTIQAAVDAAAAGDLIGIGAGTYPEHLTVNRNVHLLGSHAEETIVDGQDSGRVLTVPAGSTVTVERLILQEGLAPAGNDAAADHAEGGAGQDGGGVHNAGNLTLRSVVVRQNHAGTGGTGGFGGGRGGPGGGGGGIYNNGVLTLVATTVSENHAGRGGTGGNGQTAGGVPGSGGTGGEGGGIYNTGTLVLSDSAIVNNHGGRGGAGGRSLSPAADPGPGGPGGEAGGIYNLGLLTDEDSLVSGNQPGATGSAGCYVELLNCVLIGPAFEVEMEFIDPGSRFEGLPGDD